VDYPSLWGYARDLYQVQGVAETVAMEQIKRHYYTTHDELNPSGSSPSGLATTGRHRTGADDRPGRAPVRYTRSRRRDWR
jgi:glutathionyl-hydroquinone reductase